LKIGRLVSSSTVVPDCLDLLPDHRLEELRLLLVNAILRIQAPDQRITGREANVTQTPAPPAALPFRAATVGAVLPLVDSGVAAQTLVHRP
jgi:hypothetical protein